MAGQAKAGLTRPSPLRFAILAGASLLLPARRNVAVAMARVNAPPSEKVWRAAAWLGQQLRTLPTFELPEALGQSSVVDASNYLAPDTHMEHGGNLQAFLLRNAELAYEAVEIVNASGEITEELFLRDVLPFRHFDEPVDNWRPFFFEKLRPLVNTTDLRSLAEIVIPAAFNGALGRPVEFKSNSTPGVMAPLTETLARGYASCTGISIFLADALRAVGIPARVVGTPQWNISTGGNHNWVEVYWGGRWHFVDGAPTTGSVEWDRTWFLDNAQHAIPGTVHGLYTPVVDKEEEDAKYLITWRDKDFELPAKDRTLFYKHFGTKPKVDANGKEDAEWRRYREASEGTR